MQLLTLTKALSTPNPWQGDVKISSLCYDSRTVREGSLFFCIPGLRADGHDFAAQALSQGAAALVVERALPLDIPQVMVENTRIAMAEMAACFYEYPAKSMKILAVTGTHGKTTTCYLARAIAQAAGHKVGLLGTITNMIDDTPVGSTLTTPEAPDLHKLLHEMKEAGVSFVVMEASAHAMALHRLHGIVYDVAIFSNFSQDHLDFFGTMEDYFEAKKRLFTADMARFGVLNVDDDTVKEFAGEIVIPKVTFGIRENADIYASNIEIDERGIRYQLTFHKEKHTLEVDLHLAAIFNVYNSMAAAAACHCLGISLQDIGKGLSNVMNVPGRVEVLDTQTPYTVILDFAHAPEGLQNILKTVREFAKGRVLALFGCGGDRDREKRPVMGSIAGEMADYCILTSDNPRNEDPNAILYAIEEGVQSVGGKYCIIENRREAIAHALSIAQAGDVIVLAGKGHETYQEIRGVKGAFDEKTVVRELLEEAAKK